MNPAVKLGHLIGKKKLIDIHSDWIRYIWDSNVARALMAFRGSYKTTSCILIGAIRWMLFRPNDRIAIIKKSYSAGAQDLKAINQAMQLPAVQVLFKYVHGAYPKATVNRDGKLTYNFKKTITPEGSLTALGLDGNMTGYHFDKIICDDIITIKDRTSRAARENTVEMVREISTNIIDPGKGSGWTGTPWHRNDAWTQINRFTGIIRKYPISKCNFIGEEFLARKKASTTPYLFAANYELELLSDESLLFQDPKYGIWDYAVKGSVAHIDAAYDGDHFNAMTIVSPLSRDEYQAVGFTYAGNVQDWYGEIQRLYRKYRVKYIYVETNGDKGYLARDLKERNMQVKTYSENQNKHLKISTYLYNAWGGIIWAKETDDEYMSQILDYKEGSTPDDAPDSGSSLFREEFSTKKSAAWALYQ
ncbi:hypothetical protein AGMMS49944_04160 [Spirochaetia bacterium]|nr:hypothetical protein AGMMS49944_04160 [Spirochaetia bacterium]